MAALLAVLYREAQIRFTNLIWMFFDPFSPLIYFLLFGLMMDYTFGSPLAGLGVDYTAFFLAGVLGMAGFGIATNTAWGFFFDRDNGIFYEMLTYPMSRAQFLLGKVVFNLLLAVVQATLTVGLGVLLLDVPLRWERLPLLAAAGGGGAGGGGCFSSSPSSRSRSGATTCSTPWSTCSISSCSSPARCSIRSTPCRAGSAPPPS